MKIIAVDVFEYVLAYRGGSYALSKGRSQSHQTALVVRISTDAGLTGWGETCPLGRTHLAAFFEGERAALAILSAAAVGLDPRETSVVQTAMSRALLAGMGAKCAIDMACWDLFGKACGLPVSSLLGGRQQEIYPVWESIPLVAAEAVAAHAGEAMSRGVRVFQVKVGGDPRDDAARVASLVEAVGSGCTVIADANGGWNLPNALIAARAMADLDIRLEQPCRTMSNCAAVHAHSALPLIVDECVGNLDDLLAARTNVGASGVNIKPSRLGGITPARLLRDAASELGMMMTIDDSWGGALTTAGLSHLAISTPPDALIAATLFGELVMPMIGDAPQRLPCGGGSASTLPGLGLTIDEDQLGDPVFHI